MAKFGNTAIKDIGNSKFIRIPFEVWNDKEFPFDLEETELVVDIVGDCLRVSKHGTFSRKR